VPVEGVVNALRRLHEALVPGARVVDTQPLSPRPAVISAGRRLGSLDMREWLHTIRAVDEQLDRVVADGLFAVADERRFVVADTFDEGDECVETVSEWAGTRVSDRLAATVRRAESPFRVEEEVRLRLLVVPG
jgi:hypothetical protein